MNRRRARLLLSPRIVLPFMKAPHHMEAPMTIDLVRVRHLREQASRLAAQAGKDNEPCTPMDPARAQHLRERHHAAQRAFEQAVQAGSLLPDFKWNEPLPLPQSDHRVILIGQKA